MNVIMFTFKTSAPFVIGGKSSLVNKQNCLNTGNDLKSCNKHNELGMCFCALCADCAHIMCRIFSARQHAERAICYRPSVRLSVRLSVTRVDQSKTVERIIEILSPSDRPNILVFQHQRSLRKSDGFTPNGGAKYKGVAKTSNFRPIYGYISERVLDRGIGIVTMEDEYKVPLSMTLSDPEPQFQGHIVV